MTWQVSSGRDLSHHNPITDYRAARSGTDWVQLKVTEGVDFIDPRAGQHYAGFAGNPRGAYHFARPGSFAVQVAWFLSHKRSVGTWERPDMLDCEFDGVSGLFIRDLVAEYRRQSGIRTVLVYTGLYELTHACAPSLWYDSGTPIWAARYRKIGPPAGPDDWQRHLGWDHPGLVLYQWDNATALPGAGETDISSQRTVVAAGAEDDIVSQADIDEIKARLANLEGFEFRGGPSTTDGPHTGVSDTSVIGRVKAVQISIAALTAAVAAAASHPDITPEMLNQAVDAAVAAHTPTAAEVASANRPFLENVVREVIPADQADAIIAALVARLEGSTPST